MEDLEGLKGGGVEWRRLGEVCEIKTGKGVIIKDAIDNGKYPIISGGIGNMGYYDKYNRDENTVTISRAGTAGYVQYIESKFYLNDKCFSIIPKDKVNINTKYLYYTLKNIESKIISLKSNGSVPTVNIKKLSTIPIPLPPLSEQNRIVSILDKFTKLTTELTTELTLRKKQYEYYRDMLLTFKGTEREGGKYVRIGEIIKRVTVRVGNKQNAYPVFTVSNTQGIVKSSDYRDRNLASKDIRNYTIVEPTYFAYNPARLNVGSIAWNKNNFAGCVSPMYVVFSVDKDKVLEEYLWLNIHNPKCIKWIDNHKETGARFRFDFTKWQDISIPLPSLSEQNRIVSILDKFSALTSSLSIGLPAEIEGRKRQYEYYRDRLLSFE